jgi:hypothetical protein
MKPLWPDAAVGSFFFIFTDHNASAVYIEFLGISSRFDTGSPIVIAG